MLVHSLALALVLGALLGAPAARAAPVAAPFVADPRLFVGANVPWLTWGCDFGCGAQGGVSAPTVRATLADGFGQLKTAGIHAVRWWTFEGDAPQITRDAGGPTGLNPAVYADFDAALALAAEYDLVYDFVLFSAPTALPRAWIVDPAQRQRLADSLAPLFARYKDNPHILAWEIVNEPEWDIWNNKIPQADVQATVKLLASTVHAHSTTPVTVGSANLQGIPLWAGMGLDFYSPHWYDPMTGLACARCGDVPTVMGKLGVERLPVVLGEFYASPDKDSLQRWKDLQAKGYAGAWAWSLFSDRTADKFRIDLAAAASFIRSQTPQPAPPPANPTAGDLTADLLASWISPTYATPGQVVTIHQDVRSNRDASVLVDFEVYNDNNQKVWQFALDNQTLSASSVASLSTTFTVPTSLPSGQYTVKTGVFAPGWGTRYAWSDWVASLLVDASNVAPPEAPAQSPDATSPPPAENADVGSDADAPAPVPAQDAPAGDSGG